MSRFGKHSGKAVREDYSCIFCTEQDLKEERQQKYAIFSETMRECNPNLSEETIKSIFIAKFGK